MAATPLVTLTRLQLAYGHHPLLDNADLTITTEERVGLIGRNGAGKSSLLKLIDGRTAPDDGEVMRVGGLRISTVEQEPDLPPDQTVLEVLSGNYIDHEDWSRPARAQSLIAELGLDPDALIEGLSGGTRKRVALASALADEPDLLLLDEPTNHLDFTGIGWLEQRLQQARCSVILITHDRRFLDAVATRIVELDRGKLFSFPGNFSQWQQRKAEWLEAEKTQNAKFDKVLAQEEIWIRKGVEARRTRNEGRVLRLEQLRRDRAARRERTGNLSLAIAEGQRSGKLVAELEHVSHGYDGHLLIDDFSTVILRKDRIGLIGPNGVGKTTLLKIILGELKPGSGVVKLGTNITVGYFDQMRSQLDENATLADTISPGSEWVEIGNQRKHIMSYLEDFLFPPARAKSPVSSLSGGERARLVLARLFARPTNVLVMDEPTNDLDIETLELLEELLQDYQGTVLLVSHDRAFLNNVITQTIAWEGNARWREYAGGYDDWLEQRPDSVPHSRAAGNEPEPSQAAEPVTKTATNNNGQETKPAPTRPKPPKPVRITSWEQKELDALPDTIGALETRQAVLVEQLADGSLYASDPEKVQDINAQLEEIDADLTRLFERWEALESKRTGSE
ncbi:MAG: ATP-binding cassette domain-containing protein [Pusillimonas sp.]